MIQSLIVYAAVAVAAVWVVWSIILPRSVKQRLKGRGRPKPGCGPDCGCGD